MKQFLPLAILFCLVSNFTKAQTNFQPGYVVTLSGDTLRGEVDARRAERSARIARFRASETAAAEEYKPLQIKGYGFVNGRVYQTETVMLLDSLPSVRSYEEVVLSRRPSFLEVIVQGAGNLLYLRDERGKDHYYVRVQNKPTEELIQSFQTQALKSGTYRRPTNEFRKTLAVATQQCLAVQPAISNLKYDQQSLIKLLSSYNQCVGSKSEIHASKDRKNHLMLGAVIGGEGSQLIITDNSRGFNSTAKGSSSIKPVVGLACHLRLTGVNRTLTGRVELLYESQQYNAETLTPLPAMYALYRVKLTSITLPLLVRYTYPRGHIRPFAQAGISASYLLDSQNEYRFVQRPKTDPYPENDWMQLTTTRKIEKGIVGGLGISSILSNQHTIAVEARYVRSDGFSEHIAVGGQANRLYLLLSYDLSK